MAGGTWLTGSIIAKMIMDKTDWSAAVKTVNADIDKMGGAAVALGGRITAAGGKIQSFAKAFQTPAGN